MLCESIQYWCIVNLKASKSSQFQIGSSLWNHVVSKLAFMEFYKHKELQETIIQRFQPLFFDTCFTSEQEGQRLWAINQISVQKDNLKYFLTLGMDTSPKMRKIVLQKLHGKVYIFDEIPPNDIYNFMNRGFNDTDVEVKSEFYNFIESLILKPIKEVVPVADARKSMSQFGHDAEMEELKLGSEERKEQEKLVKMAEGQERELRYTFREFFKIMGCYRSYLIDQFSMYPEFLLKDFIIEIFGAELLLQDVQDTLADIQLYVKQEQESWQQKLKRPHFSDFCFVRMSFEYMKQLIAKNQNDQIKGSINFVENQNNRFEFDLLDTIIPTVEEYKVVFDYLVTLFEHAQPIEQPVGKTQYTEQELQTQLVQDSQPASIYSRNTSESTPEEIFAITKYGIKCLSEWVRFGENLRIGLESEKEEMKLIFFNFISDVDKSINYFTKRMQLTLETMNLNGGDNLTEEDVLDDQFYKPMNFKTFMLKKIRIEEYTNSEQHQKVPSDPDELASLMMTMYYKINFDVNEGFYKTIVDIINIIRQNVEMDQDMAEVDPATHIVLTHERLDERINTLRNQLIEIIQEKEHSTDRSEILKMLDEYEKSITEVKQCKKEQEMCNFKKKVIDRRTLYILIQFFKLWVNELSQQSGKAPDAIISYDQMNEMCNLILGVIRGSDVENVALAYMALFEVLIFKFEHASVYLSVFKMVIITHLKESPEFNISDTKWPQCLNIIKCLFEVFLISDKFCIDFFDDSIQEQRIANMEIQHNESIREGGKKDVNENATLLFERILVDFSFTSNYFVRRLCFMGLMKLIVKNRIKCSIVDEGSQNEEEKFVEQNSPAYIAITAIQFILTFQKCQGISYQIPLQNHFTLFIQKMIETPSSALDMVEGILLALCMVLSAKELKRSKQFKYKDGKKNVSIPLEQAITECDFEDLLNKLIEILKYLDSKNYQYFTQEDERNVKIFPYTLATVLYHLVGLRRQTALQNKIVEYLIQLTDLDKCNSWELDMLRQATKEASSIDHCRNLQRQIQQFLKDVREMIKQFQRNKSNKNDDPNEDEEVRQQDTGKLLSYDFRQNRMEGLILKLTEWITQANVRQIRDDEGDDQSNDHSRKQKLKALIDDEVDDLDPYFEFHQKSKVEMTGARKGMNQEKKGMHEIAEVSDENDSDVSDVSSKDIASMTPDQRFDNTFNNIMSTVAKNSRRKSDVIQDGFVTTVRRDNRIYTQNIKKVDKSDYQLSSEKEMVSGKSRQRGVEVDDQVYSDVSSDESVQLMSVGSSPQIGKKRKPKRS